MDDESYFASRALDAVHSGAPMDISTNQLPSKIVLRLVWALVVWTARLVAASGLSGLCSRSSSRGMARLRLIVTRG